MPCAYSWRLRRPRSRNPACGAGAIPRFTIAERLALSAAERSLARELDAVRVVNDKLDEAVAEIASIIEDARRGPPEGDGGEGG